MTTEAYSLEGKLKIAYERLSRANPKHELLSLAKINPESGRFDFSKDYYTRFVDFRDEFGTLGLAKYSAALKKALKD